MGILDRILAATRGRAAGIRALQSALRRHAGRPQGLAVLRVDGDHFSAINELHGHRVGDRALLAMARRLRQAAPAAHRLLHLGGDGFLMLLDGVACPTALRAAADRLVDAFDAPLAVAGTPVYASVSIGAAHAGSGPARAEPLFAAAESALREAKRAGRRCARLHDDAAGQREQRRAQSLHALRHAFAQGHLLLHYQPKLRLSDGQCTGFEALLRQRTPQGLAGPGELIEAAESSGFIARLGEWVFDQAADQSRRWCAQGLQLPIAVNLSVRQFQDHRFLDFVDKRVAAEPRLPGRLQLEITESALALDPPQVASALARLRALGFDIQVDDFGTGYSTMGFLARMPVDSLKIDRSFIAGLPEGRECRQLARSLIVMAHDMALTVVAEGVETPEQAQWLRDAGCDQAQGFHFARALPPEQAAEFARGLRPGSERPPDCDASGTCRLQPCTC